MYFTRFLNPVKKEENDKKFFEYIISKKEFSYFNLGLRFIFDIDIFIITLKKEKINDIIKGIENINIFSDEKKILLYFKSDYWKGLLKEFNKANPD